jgi:hypothetical protein
MTPPNATNPRKAMGEPLPEAFPAGVIVMLPTTFEPESW